MYIVITLLIAVITICEIIQFLLKIIHLNVAKTVTRLKNQVEPKNRNIGTS